MSPPLISVVTPVYNTDPAVLVACLESVRRQSFGDWEHCLVDDASPNAEVRAILAAAAAKDDRVRVAHRATNGGIVAASNDALALATGEFLAFLDHDDLLTPGVLEAVADAIRADPELDYLYTDEDHLTAEGSTFHPTYKPDWSPERFRSHMYTCHLSVVRRSLALDVGGFHAGYEGSQDYDLVLRVTERARHIRHLPMIGYHWRMGPESTAANPDAKPYAHGAGLRAVQAHCDRIGLDATVEMLPPPPPGYHRVVRSLRGNPSVAVIVVSDGTTGRVWSKPRTFVAAAVEGVVKRGGHDVSAVIVASPAPLPGPAREALDEAFPAGVRSVVVPDASRSELLNHAAARAGTDFLLLLHDDVEVVTDGFVPTMLALAQGDDVGMVGCRLLAADGTLDHAGLVFTGRPGFVYHGRGAHELGWSGLLIVEREVSGVSSACAVVPAAVFDQVGGLSPAFTGDDADVDLSLKIRRLGRRILYTPHATLHHFRATDGRRPGDLAALQDRWRQELTSDPYHHPKLLRDRDDWAVPFGPDA
jgi:GT2 family glycosyltransferase